MTDSLAAQPTGPTCPWCSAELPSSAAATCPSCGATLIGEADAPLPGLTTIDPEAVARGVRPVTPERRNKLLSWITGDEEEGEEAPATHESLAPPPPDVQREMLRMELEAEVADLQAEADALAAAAREEGLTEDEEALEAVADDAAASQADLQAAAPDADRLATEGATVAAHAGDPASEPGVTEAGDRPSTTPGATA